MPLKNFFFLVLLLLSLSGCASLKQEAPDISYYTLEYAFPVHADAEPLPVILQVKRFSASPAYETERMVYRHADYQRSTYFYHRWRARPTDLVTYALSHDLKERGRLKAVVGPITSISPSHFLEGTVEEFLQWNESASWQAMLSLSVTLLRAGEPDPGKRVLLQKRFTASSPCRNQQPESVAAAMSVAMADISGQIEEALHQALSREAR